MSIEALKEQYPVQLFWIQIAVYDGAVRCLIRENWAVLRGDYYLTPREERVELSIIMVQTGSIEDMELPRMMICDDPARVDECVQLLQEGLRSAVKQLKEKVEEIEHIANGEDVIYKRQDFSGNVTYTTAKTGS